MSMAPPPPPPAGNTGQFAQAMQGVGVLTSLVGMSTSAIGAYFNAKSQQVSLQSQASTLKFQAELGQINASLVELQAQQIMRAGRMQQWAVGLKAGAIKSSARASMAARGIQAGEGSAAEVIATTDLMKEVDLMTLESNTVRAAEAERMRKVGIESSAMMQQISAQNLNASAGTISPGLAATTTLLGGASSLASSYYRDNSLQRLLAGSA